MAGMTKLKRMTRDMYTTREHGSGLVFRFVCRHYFVLMDNIF